MKIEFNVKSFLEGLKIVRAVVSPGAPMAEFNCVYIDALNEHVNIRTTDLNVWYQSEVLEATVIDPGIALINIGVLCGVVEKIDTDTFILNEVEARWFEISWGNFNFKIAGLDHIDFPIEKDQPNSIAEFSINSYDWFSAIENVIKVKENVKALSKKICFEIKNKVLRIVSTDGSRMHESSIVLADSQDCSFNIQKNCFVKFLKILKSVVVKHNIIAFKVLKNKLLVSVGKTNIDCCLSEEKDTLNYSNFNMLEVSFSSVEIKNALSIVEVIDSTVRISGGEEQEYVTISATNSDIGEVKGTVDCSIIPKDFIYTFNCKYLIDGIINEKSCFSLPKAEGIPACITLKENDVLSHRNIIMPMKG